MKPAGVFFRQFRAIWCFLLGIIILAAGLGSADHFFSEGILIVLGAATFFFLLGGYWLWSARKSRRSIFKTRDENSKITSPKKYPAAATNLDSPPRNRTTPILVSLYDSQKSPIDPTLNSGYVPVRPLPGKSDWKTEIDTLREHLSATFFLTVEQWEDYINQSSHPRETVFAWLHLAQTLTGMAEHYSFSPEQRQECFDLLTACLTGSQETLSERFEGRVLSTEECEIAIQHYYQIPHA